MTDEQKLEAMIEAAAERGARKALQRVGIDVKDDWKETQRDMAFLRNFRTGAQTTRIRVIAATLVALVTGSAWLLWEGVLAVVRG